MSHSQFRRIKTYTTHLHGLIFNASIYYRQDQPGIYTSSSDDAARVWRAARACARAHHQHTHRRVTLNAITPHNAATAVGLVANPVASPRVVCRFVA